MGPARIFKFGPALRINHPLTSTVMIAKLSAPRGETGRDCRTRPAARPARTGRVRIRRMPDGGPDPTGPESLPRQAPVSAAPSSCPVQAVFDDGAARAGPGCHTRELDLHFDLTAGTSQWAARSRLLRQMRSELALGLRRAQLSQRFLRLPDGGTRAARQEQLDSLRRRGEARRQPPNGPAATLPVRTACRAAGVCAAAPKFALPC